jgi:hypothetical protein
MSGPGPGELNRFETYVRWTGLLIGLPVGFVVGAFYVMLLMRVMQ